MGQGSEILETDYKKLWSDRNTVCTLKTMGNSGKCMFQ